jgi:type II secretory pathway component PulF
MPTFSYTARDPHGNTVSGMIEASEPRGAAESLHEQGLFPMRIEQVGRTMARTLKENDQLPSEEATPDGVPVAPLPPDEPGTFAPPLQAPGPAGPPPPTGDNGSNGFAPEPRPKIEMIPWATGVRLPELAVMYRELATLMNAGVPMGQSFAALSDQSRSVRLRAILRDCEAAIARGQPISSVMREHPTVFTPLQYEMIRAGETTGGIDLMCSRLAGYLEREIELRRRIKQQTLTQKFTLGVAALVIMVLSAVTGGAAMFWTAFGTEATIVGVGFGLWWGGRYLYQFPEFAAGWDTIKLAIPGIGGVGRRYATARFARSLATLYTGGVPIFRAVTIAAKTCGNGAIASQLLSQVDSLNHGGSITDLLMRARLLSPLAVQMARTGEQTGSLDVMMEKVADNLESEADVQAHQLSVTLGVSMTLIAGLITLIICIAGYGGYLHQATNVDGH